MLCGVTYTHWPRVLNMSECHIVLDLTAAMGFDVITFGKKIEMEDSTTKY